MIGKPVNRLEAFSDAVFAISATLLVVSLEVPESFQGLLDNLAGFPAFAFSFAMLMLIWVEHNRFFRLSGLQDAPTIALNSLLLFVVLFFVYPLKFLALSFSAWALGLGPDMIGSQRDLQSMFMLYGAGWLAVFVCFAGLYWHAARHAGLERRQRFEAHLHAQNSLLTAGVGLLSVLVAWSGFGLWFGLPGMVYALLGVTNPVFWILADRRRARHDLAT